MKFDEVDKEYLEARKTVSKKYGPRELWSVVDYWPLYCGYQNLARYIAILDILRSVQSVPGHVAEFGLYRGANLMFMAKVMRLLDPMSSKVLFGFDSFEGLATFSEQDHDAIAHKGRFASPCDELIDLIALYGLNDEVRIVKGLIQETLPQLLQSRQELSFSLVFCDTDLYEPTRIILDMLHPRLSKGGLFILDEWNHEIYQGETIAVREFLESHVNEYDMISPHGTRHPTLILKKLVG